MSLIIGRTCLSYCSRKVLKIASLPTPLREIGEMSADADRTDKLNVEHNTLDSEFYIRLGKEKAYLQYSQINPNLVDLEHTVVPERHRGHGIGHVLAKSVFDHFVEKDMNMKLTCEFLQKFYNENPLPHYREKVQL